MNEITLLASYFKHPSFSEEKEWRLIVKLDYAPDEDIKFREGKTYLIQYIELPFDFSFLSSIVIGPTSNKELA